MNRPYPTLEGFERLPERVSNFNPLNRTLRGLPRADPTLNIDPVACS
jgi:hypothetical protein